MKRSTWDQPTALPDGTSDNWRERLDGRWVSPKGKAGPEWFSRGYMPHREGRNLLQHVTVHLADSLPVDARRRIERALSAVPEEERDVERRRCLQDWLDAGYGCCVLARPEIAQLVQDALLYFERERYEMHAWTVMPNHLHALFEPLGEWTVAQVLTSWKRYTAHRIRAMLGPGSPPAGTVWQREYWDRFIRNERHYGRAVEYIHGNPVKAGLCRDPKDWPWGSARWWAGDERRLPGHAGPGDHGIRPR